MSGIGEAGGGGQAELDVLAFVRRQARPDQVFGGPGARGTAEAGDRAPIRAVGTRLVPVGGDDLLGSTIYPSPVAQDAARSVRMRALIRAVAGYQRHEPSNAFNAHRSYPSAQSKFAAELFIGIGATTWYYDAAWDALRPVGADGDPWRALDEGADAFVAVLGRPGRLPGYYRDLRWALTLCEAGHLSGLTVEVARALGFEAEALTEFDDRGLLDRIGAETPDAWLPATIITLDGTRPRFGPSARVWPEPEDAVLAVDRLGWQVSDAAESPAKEGREARLAAVTASAAARDVAAATGATADKTGAAVAAAAAATAAATAAADDVVAAGAAVTGGVAATAAAAAGDVVAASGATAERIGAVAAASVATWSETLFTRSSGRAPGGLTASPAPLPAGVVDRALAAAEGAVRDWGSLDLRVAVERTEGIADGLYTWEAGKLLLRTPGPVMAAVQRAFFYPQTVTRVDTCNVALFCVVDYPAVLGAEGPRGLRRTQLRVGALMQAAALACAAEGAFLRPCRSFGPDALSELLGLDADQTVAYLCLIGRSRFTDLMLDLRLPSS